MIPWLITGGWNPPGAVPLSLVVQKHPRCSQNLSYCLCKRKCSTGHKHWLVTIFGASWGQQVPWVKNFSKALWHFREQENAPHTILSLLSEDTTSCEMIKKLSWFGLSSQLSRGHGGWKYHPWDHTQWQQRSCRCQHERERRWRWEMRIMAA